MSPEHSLAAVAEPALSPVVIERRIYLIRGQKVMLDSDLAGLYEVRTFNLNKAVKRNPERFPADFMFQLTKEEAAALRFQIGISNKSRGGRRYLPYAFTEHGVAMLSSVLSSPRAVQMNILIVRAFIRLREVLASNRELAHRLDQVETRLRQQGTAIAILVEEITKLAAPGDEEKPRFGFVPQP